MHIWQLSCERRPKMTHIWAGCFVPSPKYIISRSLAKTFRIRSPCCVINIRSIRYLQPVDQMAQIYHKSPTNISSLLYFQKLSAFIRSPCHKNPIYQKWKVSNIYDQLKLSFWNVSNINAVFLTKWNFTSAMI